MCMLLARSDSIPIQAINGTARGTNDGRLFDGNSWVTMTTIQRRLVQRLKCLRHDRDLSQAALAKRSGLTREFIARLELGEHDPSLSTLAKLAKALKVPLSSLLS